MFSLSSLIGNGEKGPKELEFTPIGKRGLRLGSKPHGSTQNQTTTPNTRRYGLNQEKVAESNIESPYDSTPGRFDSTFSMDDLDHVPFERAELNKPKDNGVRFQQSIVSDGSSSIQGLQTEVKELLHENYNLKVEVATLKQYLRQSPLETRDLALENLNLKQELIGLKRELEGLQRAGVSEQVLLERDREIQRLQSSLEELRHTQNSKPVSSDVFERLEKLEIENQALRREAQQALSRGTSNEDMNELKAELHRAKAQLAALPPNAEEHVHNLDSENEVLSRKLKLALTDARQLQDERDSFEDQVNALNLELGNKKQELERLRQETQDQHSHNRSLGDLQGELQAARREIDDLSSKLSAARKELAESKSKRSGTERSNRQAIDELEDQVTLLNSRLEVANKNLKEKDHDNYELKAEIRSLMNERNSHFDDQATIRHYETQVEKLRQKEKSLSDELVTLRNQLAESQTNKSMVSEREEKLTSEIAELNSKLEYYEEQYELLEDSKALLDSEVELLETKLRNAEGQLKSADLDQRNLDDRNLELEKEIETLRSKLRRSELTDAHRYNESALFELEELHKKREDAEKARLSTVVADLQNEVKSLKRDLERARSDRAYSSEARNVDILSSREVHKLKLELEDREQELSEQRSKHNRLLNSIKDKDLAIDALESRIRELNRELNTSMSGNNRWNELSKLEAEHELQLRNLRFEQEKNLRNLQLDNERLEFSLRDEIRYYKTQIEMFKNREPSLQSNEHSSAMVVLLEAQVEQANRTINELKDRLQKFQMADSEALEAANKHQVEVRLLQRQLENLQSQFDDLNSDYKTVVTQKESLRAENSTLKTKQYSSEHEKEELKMKNDKLRGQVFHFESNDGKSNSQSKSFQNEIKGLNNQVSDLQSKNESLTRKLDREQRANLNNEGLKTELDLAVLDKTDLQKKNDSLNLELDSALKALAKLESKLQALEADQAKKLRDSADEELNKRLAATKIASKEETSLKVVARLMANKNYYSQAKALEWAARWEELKMVNEYAAKELRAINARFRVEPYGAVYLIKEKPTLKAVAQMVLGVVRMRRMGEKARQRQTMFKKIQLNITRDEDLLKAESREHQ